MRLTTFVGWCGPQLRNWLGIVAELVVIVFVLEIIVPITAYLNLQASTELITLHISDWYRVLALQVGFGLISVLALLRLLETPSLRGLVSAVAVVGTIAGDDTVLVIARSRPAAQRLLRRLTAISEEEA